MFTYDINGPLFLKSSVIKREAFLCKRIKFTFCFEIPPYFPSAKKGW